MPGPEDGTHLESRTQLSAFVSWGWVSGNLDRMEFPWRAAVYAGLVAVAGIVLQSLIAPEVPAWGFIEILGFAVAIGILVVATLRMLMRRSTRPDHE